MQCTVGDRNSNRVANCLLHLQLLFVNILCIKYYFQFIDLVYDSYFNATLNCTKAQPITRLDGRSFQCRKWCEGNICCICVFSFDSIQHKQGKFCFCSNVIEGRSTCCLFRNSCYVNLKLFINRRLEYTHIAQYTWIYNEKFIKKIHTKSIYS